uniref:F-box domain-containing protein n=1 Tax=Phytophthora ramorum TaxID=164328 RepID=H3GDK9_PHYRM
MEMFTCVLAFLDAVSLTRLLQVEKRSCTSVRKLVHSFHTARARLALASLCFSRLRVEFQAYYQELETRNIPRSSDPRVPPRVVSIWTERGQVADGSVTLQPVELPSVHKDGVTARFVGDVDDAAKRRPMLTNVVQRNRRIYTMVSIKLLQSGSDAEDNESGDGGGLVLRRYSYLKEFGEWKTPTLPEKRMLAAASIGSRRGRFDLCSQDGSAVLELDVPSGTDAQTDYYLRTGVEKFEVATCRADSSFGRSIKVALPSDPGYVWLEWHCTTERGKSQSMVICEPYSSIGYLAYSSRFLRLILGDGGA